MTPKSRIDQALRAKPAATAGTKIRRPLPPLSVLLVEDNPTNRVLAIELLEQLGCTVTIAEDGPQAIALAGAKEFDAVFMDCGLPGLDGYSATAVIRQQQRGPRRMPIIALTANSGRGERQRCLEAGMDDYLGKPAVLPALRAALRRWCRPGPSAATVRIQPFTHAAALDRMGGSEDLLARVVASFLRNLPPMRTQAREGLERRNSEVLEFAAHAFLGSLGMFAANPALASALQLEAAAAASDWAAAVRCHRQLEKDLAKLVPALTALVAGPAAAATPP